ncbi:MAG: DUF4105 domain-containing protein [Tahibacter sp.]
MSAPAPSRRRWRRLTALAFVASVVAYLILVLLVRPSNDRNWAADQQRTASADFAGPVVRLHNVRNALYRSTTDFDVRWEDRTIDLRELDSLWFIVEPFAEWRGPAHTFMSFGFRGGEYLGISIEIRKEVGENFSPLLALFRQYELMYVIGDERDLIGLRANFRHDDVYLYKIRATPEQMRQLLVSMLERTNQIGRSPEFYNTLTNTCASNIATHVNAMVPGRIPWSYKTLLPAFADDLGFDLGLIDTTLPRDQYRAAHRINDLAKIHADSATFSRDIREGQ